MWRAAPTNEAARHFYATDLSFCPRFALSLHKKIIQEDFDKTAQLMKAYLEYALNQEGHLVHIDSVPNGNECGCICPACKKPLQAKNAGQIRIHHFAHNSGVDCPAALETTLHLLAKDKIQKAFNKQEVFSMKFVCHSYCENITTCDFVKYSNCKNVEHRKFNLKAYYDSCEQEVPYDNVKRRSDLKIWSSVHPEMEPIYIEFFVTHQSEYEKLHSGNKIIEVKIENEQDIDNIIQQGFIETQHTFSFHRENKAPKTSFYGFTKEDYRNKNIFLHNSGIVCPADLETTLHLLAKDKIQKAFNKQEVFYMKFEYHSYCDKINTCDFVRHSNCKNVEHRKFNLKAYYDSCEQEVPYDNVKRRSDLKIWSSVHPEMGPIYIEFFVTHQSEYEKLHSGNKIIEVKIENEQDIDNIIQQGFTESESEYIVPFHGENKTPKISFYGFKKEDYCNKNLNKEIVFSRYILYPSGKFQYYKDDCLCKELKRTQPKALCEICFHSTFNIYNLAKWLGYQKFSIKNCFLCKNYVYSSGGGMLCRLYKHLKISRFEKHDTARAKTCSRFVLNEQEKNEYLNKQNDIPKTEL